MHGMNKIICLLMAVFLLPFAFQTSKKDVFYDYFSSNYDCSFCYVLREKDAAHVSLSKYQNQITTGGYSFVYFEEDAPLPPKPIYRQVEMPGKNIDKISAELSISIFKTQNDIYTIMYGYTPILPDYLYCGGYKMNVQIVIKQDSIIIGYPAIYTGF